MTIDEVRMRIDQIESIQQRSPDAAQVLQQYMMRNFFEYAAEECQDPEIQIMARKIWKHLER